MPLPRTTRPVWICNYLHHFPPFLAASLSALCSRSLHVKVNPVTCGLYYICYCHLKYLSSWSHWSSSYHQQPAPCLSSQLASHNSYLIKQLSSLTSYLWVLHTVLLWHLPWVHPLNSSWRTPTNSILPNPTETFPPSSIWFNLLLAFIQKILMDPHCMPDTVPFTGKREVIKQTTDRELTFWGMKEKTDHKQFQR